PAVFLLHFAVNGSDMYKQPLIGQSGGPRHFPAALPAVESAFANRQHSAHRSHRPMAFHFLNPGVLCSVSCAKYAAAFFAMSRSMRSCTTSARKREISICSALTEAVEAGFSLPPNWPRRCWRTQLLRLAFGIPSDSATDPIETPANTWRTLSSLNSCVYFPRLNVSDISYSLVPI